MMYLEYAYFGVATLPTRMEHFNYCSIVQLNCCKWKTKTAESDDTEPEKISSHFSGRCKIL